MQRTVSSRLEATLQGETDMVFAIAVSESAELASEQLRFVLDGREVEPTELIDGGTRLHRLRLGPGKLVTEYSATVSGDREQRAPRETELLAYLRPSRYCDSDALTPTARYEFAGLEGLPLTDAVVGWVADRLSYVPGSSSGTDGATDTLLARRGVCRDYAHLVVALLRAKDVPTRLASVYAPGLSPMDFHAVAEAWVDGAWHVLDATRLAPRQSLVRIATGRDAADTAFLTNHHADLILDDLEVFAVAEQLPYDDGGPVRLA